MPRATLSLFEIPAADPGRLAGFFAAVFGWESAEVPWAGPRYVRLLAPEDPRRPGGGILERGAGGEALVDRLTVMVDIEGEPLDAVLDRVAENGGSVLARPTAIGDLGAYARFLDPEGNSFGLWQKRPAQAGG